MSEEKFICIKCKSNNVEEISNQTLFCCDCNNIFTVSNFRICKKTLYKILAHKTNENPLQEIVDDSMGYIYKMGMVLYPQIYSDLRSSIRSGQHPSIIAAKLSALEMFAEDIYKNKNKNRIEGDVS